MALTINSDKPAKEVNYGVTVPTAFILLALGVVGFFLVYRSVITKQGAAYLDNPVLQWMVTQRNDILTVIMEAVTNALSPVVIAGGTLLIAVIWIIRKREIWRPFLFAAAMGVTFAAATLIKDVVQRGRPPSNVMVAPLETNFSFPSGHTIGVAALVFVLAYLICSRARRVSVTLAWGFLCIVAVTVIAFSRLYLGYHWFTDVTASICLALAVLAIIMLLDPLAALFKRKSTS